MELVEDAIPLCTPYSAVNASVLKVQLWSVSYVASVFLQPINKVTTPVWIWVEQISNCSTDIVLLSKIAMFAKVKECYTIKIVYRLWSIVHKYVVEQSAVTAFSPPLMKKFNFWKILLLMYIILEVVTVLKQWNWTCISN